MSNIDLTEMSRAELVVLQGEIKARLKEHRPYRIRERLIRCGKLGCWCAKGDRGHGPYLSAVYREGGKTKTVAIGPKLAEWEMIDAVPGLPDLHDFLVVPDHKYLGMVRSETNDWVYVTLSASQFEARYGLPREDDVFDRPSKFWGPRSEYDRFQAEYELALQLREMPYNEWSGYGVSTLAGVAILEALEARNYYLKR